LFPLLSTGPKEVSNNKLSLIIDTCTERSVVALASEAGLVHSAPLPKGFATSRHLFPAIEQLMEGISAAAELSCIIVGVGPGSYTGMRVGAAAALALGYGWKKPVMGVTTLEGLFSSHDGRFVSVIDARMGGVYYLLGERSGEEIVFFGRPMRASITDAISHWAGVSYAVTPHAEQLRSQIPMALLWEEKAIDPYQLHKGAQRRLAQGCGGEEMAVPRLSLELLYLRKVQAEIDKETAK